LTPGVPIPLRADDGAAEVRLYDQSVEVRTLAG
jgi:hypothetical protein